MGQYINTHDRERMTVREKKGKHKVTNNTRCKVALWCSGLKVWCGQAWTGCATNVVVEVLCDPHVCLQQQTHDVLGTVGVCLVLRV